MSLPVALHRQNYTRWDIIKPHSLFRYYSVSIFCKVGAPGYIASVVVGIVASVAMACVIPTIDKVIYYKMKWITV